MSRFPDEDGSGSEESEFLADETEFALFQTNQQLAAIQSVADAFRDLAGRKALLYFSEDFPIEVLKPSIRCGWSPISVTKPT